MDVSSDAALLPIIDRIYASVEQPELWPDTIYEIGERIGGRRGFWGIDPERELPDADRELNEQWRRAGSHAFFLSRTDLKVLDEYVDEFGEMIVSFLKIISLNILCSQGDIDRREIIGLRLAHRYLPAFETASGGSLSSASKSSLRRLIAALWTEGCVFDGDGLRSIRLILPHLDRALRLQMRLAAAELRADAVSGALDCLTLGVIFVDRSGMPLWLNRCAQELVKSSPVLRLSPTGSSGRCSSNSRSFREFVKCAVSGGSQNILTISRNFDARPLVVVALPLRPADTSVAPSGLTCGVLFVNDPDRIENPSVNCLRQAFGLTHREAQVAIAIARGGGVQAAALSMGVAVTTARSQLQQAFAKTGTSHQAELTALLHRTLAPLRQS